VKKISITLFKLFKQSVSISYNYNLNVHSVEMQIHVVSKGKSRRSCNRCITGCSKKVEFVVKVASGKNSKFCKDLNIRYTRQQRLIHTTYKVETNWRTTFVNVWRRSVTK